MTGLVVGDRAAPFTIRHAPGSDVRFALLLTDAAGATTSLPAGAVVELIIDGLPASLPGVVAAGRVDWDIQAAEFAGLPTLATMAVWYRQGGHDERWFAGYYQDTTGSTSTVQVPGTVVVSTDGVQLVTVALTTGLQGPTGPTGPTGATGPTGDAAALAVHAAAADPHNAYLTAAEGNAAYAGVSKYDNGGALLRPIRVPTLVVDQMWPTRQYDLQIVWADGSTLYAVGPDRTVYKSLNDGATWSKRGHSATVGASVLFLKTVSGALLSAAGTPTTIYRSTDDGATWLSVHTWPTLGAPRLMGSCSWAIDPVSGFIYAGEYQSVDTNITVVNVYRSTDDGATWSVFHAFPGPTSAAADKIRHVHSIQWDPFAARMVVLTGDSEATAGMYRVNAAGSALEPLLLNSDIGTLPGGSVEGARSIGLIPFADYIVYTGDATSNPYLMRVARSALGTANPAVERLYRLNSCGWFACRASDDGSRWVFSSSPEGSGAFAALDKSIHLYAVEDQGAVVYEVGALATDVATTAALAPVGHPLQGDVFWLKSHNTGTKEGTWKCRLARGAAAIPSAPVRGIVTGWVTLSTPAATLPVAPSSTSPAKIVLGRDLCPSYTRTLHVLEAAVWDEANLYTRMKIRIVKVSDGSILYESIQRSTRRALQQYSVPVFSLGSVSAGTEIEVQVVNVSTTATPTGTASLTYGWGA